MGAKRDPFFEKKNVTWWNKYGLYFTEMKNINLLNIGVHLMHLVTSSEGLPVWLDHTLYEF